MARARVEYAQTSGDGDGGARTKAAKIGEKPSGVKEKSGGAPTSRAGGCEPSLFALPSFSKVEMENT